MNTMAQNRFSSQWLVTAAALLCVVCAGKAVAGPGPDETASVTISFSDLDLSKPEGAQMLYRRIAAAARTVCGVSQAKQLKEIALAKDCYTAAVANAVATVNRPLLTALHRSKVARTAIG